MSSTQTPATTPSNTTSMSSTLTVQHTTQTPVITASNTPLPTPTDMSGTETEDGGVPIAAAVVAGVIGAIVVIFALLVTVVFSWKNKKSGRYLHICIHKL